MKALPKIKEELRESLVDKGGVFVINSILDLLPTNNPKCDLLLALKTEYKELKTASIGGILSFDEKKLWLARLNKRLLEFVRQLEAEDFDASLKRSKLSGKPKIQRGHVLYQIPQEMQLDKESRCLVRIAFDREMILEALDLDEETTIKSGLRISEYMKVEVKDPAEVPVFKIRTTSEPVQFIDEDDYTEWRFWVKPLQLGKHLLALKVSVIQRINGEDHIREKTLDESVVIITEAPAAEATPAWKKDSEPLLMPCALETVTPRRFPRLGGGMRAMALGLALLTGVSSVAYAYVPAFSERVDWFNTTQLQDTEEAYEEFIDEYPQSKQKEKALFRKAKAIQRDDTAQPERAEEAMLDYIAYTETFGGEAKYLDEAWWTVAHLSQNPEDYQQYLALDGQQPREAEAQAAIAELEPKLWQVASSQPSAIQLDRFLRIYPNSEHRPAALQQLADSTTWQTAPAPLPERILRDTTGWQQRLQTYATAATDRVLAKKLQRRASEPVLYPTPKRTSQPDRPTSSTTDEASEAEKSGQLATTAPAAQNAKPATTAVPSQQTTTASAADNKTAPPTAAETPPCVDADQDGICADEDCNDNNPAREASTDTDGDGVCDDIDQCKGEIGTLANQGCPVPKGSAPFIAPEMISISGGTFEMGDVMGDDEEADETPHTVTVSGFQLGKYEVTFAEYDAFCEATNAEKPEDEGWGRAQRPVINVTWYDAVAYCNWLSTQQDYTPVYTINGENVSTNWSANGYRLPTEAEWEYAARQKGQKVRFGNGKDTADPVTINFDGSESYKKDYSISGTYRRKTVLVGSLNSPNSLGLHDMSGNVLELCWDRYDSDYYGKSPQNNPKGAASGSLRVLRGGSWFDDPRNCRSADRDGIAPSGRGDGVGFRLARAPLQ